MEPRFTVKTERADHVIGAERECIHGDVEYIIPLAAFAPELPEELT